jgi:hypothetical protein
VQPAFVRCRARHGASSTKSDRTEPDEHPMPGVLTPTLAAFERSP